MIRAGKRLTAEAAQAARIAAWKADGVNAFRFHAVLDSHTTPGCALRDGKLYEFDTLAPIKHTVPLERRPPRHWNCRSILLPMAYGPDIPMPEDGGEGSFRDYFDSLSGPEQDRLFGQGRADLFRRGVITQSDLVRQDGSMMTLAELREAHVTPETQIALWWKRPRGNVSVGSTSKVVADSIGAAANDVILSQYTRKKQLSHHPELEAEDYARLPALLRAPKEHFLAGKARHVAVISDDGKLWVAILKTDRGGRIFLQSFRRTDLADIARLKAGKSGKKKGGH